MKKKKLVAGLGGTALMLSVVIGFSVVKASEDYVAVPSQGVREALLGDEYSGYRSVMTSEEIANFEEFNSLPKDVFSREQQNEQNEMQVVNGDSSSLEGLQHASNLDYLDYEGSLLDATPISKLSNLKTLKLNLTDKSVVPSLDFLEELESLQSFELHQYQGIGGIVPSDLSALETFENPDKKFEALVSVDGTLASQVRLSRNNPNHAMYLPVKLPRQMETGEQSIVVHDQEFGYEEMDAEGEPTGKLIWENIPEETEYLHISVWIETPDEMRDHFFVKFWGQMKIPIVWQD
ncbi:hypothetical protein [Enterococcus sp. LJL51]|uniref:hypothetical protein n=1 Tax=Enterococcus sp. LJL51 TaxID=3416656 RepID=UPI003CFA4414